MQNRCRAEFAIQIETAVRATLDVHILHTFVFESCFHLQKCAYRQKRGMRISSCVNMKMHAGVRWLMIYITLQNNRFYILFACKGRDRVLA
jgi:hypothetical protein